MSIGSRLKDARLALQMTQEDLAAAVGVTKGAIGNYETEVSSPKETVLIKLMEVLHVDANYLYQDYVSNYDNLTSDERRLVVLFRGADERARDDVFNLLSSHQKKDMSSKAE